MLANATRQLGALCAGKRRDHLSSLAGFCENVTFHQPAIYRLLLLQRQKERQLAGGGQHREEMAEALTCLDEKASNSGSTAIAVTLWLTQWVRCWVVSTMLGR